MDRLLLDYLPPVLQNVREMRALMSTEQAEVETLWNRIDDVLKNSFVADADEAGVARWEEMLGIAPKAADTLDVRKFRVLTRLTEQMPFTETVLHQQLAALCGPDGYTLEILGGAYTVKVRVALTAKGKFDEISVLLRRIVPANMLIDLSLLYNQHQMLAQFTHAQLGAYTHKYLRSEVLTDG